MNRKAVQFILLIALLLPVSSLSPQWLQSDAPNGGHTTCVTVLGNDLFASFEGGGVYRSTDNGASWMDVTNNLRSRYVTILFVSGSNIYAGASGIIYKSGDKGGCWTELSKGLPESTSINGFAEIGTNLFVATAHGIFISKDQGVTWNPASNGLAEKNAACLTAVGTDLYAGLRTEGIYKSTDYGVSWFRASAGLESKNITAFINVQDRIIAGATNGLYITYNKGGYWAFKEIGINQVTAFAAKGSTIIAGGQCNEGSVLAMSTDAGDSWIRISDGIMAKNVKGIVYKDSYIIVGCKYTGLHITQNIRDGWTPINNGIKAISVSAMAMDNDNVYCGTKGFGIFFSKDNGKNWCVKNNGLTNGFIQTISVRGSELFAGTLYGLFRSADKGESWKEVLENFPVSAIAYDNNRILAGATGRIYVSGDNCNSWYNVANGIPSNAVVNALYIKDRIGYAGTSAGLFMSDIRNTTWREISKGLPNKNIRAMILTESGIIAGTYGEGVWMTNDNGGKWVRISQNPSMNHVEAITVLDDIIFVTAGSCIYRTLDLGKNWDCIADGLPGVTIGKLAANSSMLFAGLEGSGIWVKPLGEILKYTICASQEPAAGGTVNGTGTYKYGSMATLTAVPKDDYKFYNWSEHGKILSTDTDISFRVIENRCLVANFGYVRDTLTILYVNDSHSSMAPLGPRTKELQGTRGGIARLASAIGMNRMTERNSLTLHAGDAFAGDLLFNEKLVGAEFKILNSIGLDAFTLGNHEFDLSSAVLLDVLKGAFPKCDAYPFLGANLIIPDELKDLKNFVKPYTIKKSGGLKVGIFGLITPSANVLSSPGPAFVDTSIIEEAAAIVQELKENNCDVIVLLSHLGLTLDKLVAEYVPGINVIVGGHDHYLLKTPVEVTNIAGGKTYILQAESHYQNLGKIKLFAKGSDVKVLESKIIQLNETIPEEPTVKAMVDVMTSETEKMFGPVYTKQIGTAAAFFKEVADSLTYEGNHDTPVGNLVADAFREKLGTDIAIEPGGSTSQPIYQGPIVGADAFRAMGYGFNLGLRMVRFCITGADLWRALELTLANLEETDDFLPQVSGMKYIYNPKNAPGSRVTSVTINGKPLDPAVTYTASGNEFLVGILTSAMGIPLCNIHVYDDMTEYQVVSEYITKMKTISPLVEGRVVASFKKPLSKDVQLAKGLPVDYQLMQNSPNPFNPSTQIEFAIPKDEYVVLKIYNTLGQEVETLVNENMNAGVYKYTWVPKNLASGIYIYQLSAGKFSQAKKLVLMK